MTLIKTALNEIGSCDLKNIIEFITNMNYELKKHKNKLYTAIIIQNLLEKVKAADIIINNDSCRKFLLTHENNAANDDNGTWKKILVWILLRPGVKEINHYNAIEYYRFSLRRQQILRNIIVNNPSCAPLASYLLIVSDGLETGMNAQSLVIDQKIESLQSIIDHYPNSEFAAGAMINIMGCYTSCGKIDKAIQICRSVNEQFKNFHIGLNDLYSEMYLDLVNKFIEINDKNNAESFFKLINVNIADYDILKHSFSEDIKLLKNR